MSGLAKWRAGEIATLSARVTELEEERDAAYARESEHGDSQHERQVLYEENRAFAARVTELETELREAWNAVLAEARSTPAGTPKGNLALHHELRAERERDESLNRKRPRASSDAGTPE